MKFENLLTYQKADLAYKKMHDEIAANPDYKEMKIRKDEFNAAKQKVSDSEALAENVLTAYNGAMEYLNKNAARIAELWDRLGAENLSEDEEKAIVEQLEQLRTAVAEWDKKAAQLKENADKALSDYAKAQKTGKTARDAYNVAKQKYDNFKKSKEDGLNELKTARDKLESSVEPELMKMYKTITAENRYPAFVPVMGDNDSVCGACGMMLADAAKNDLKNNGYCRCETCRRVIIKQ